MECSFVFMDVKGTNILVSLRVEKQNFVMPFFFYNFVLDYGCILLQTIQVEGGLRVSIANYRLSIVDVVKGWKLEAGRRASQVQRQSAEYQIHKGL